MKLVVIQDGVQKIEGMKAKAKSKEDGINTHIAWRSIDNGLVLQMK